MVLWMARPYKHAKTGVYWLRKVVPVPLRPILGRRELKETLRTKDPREAATAAPAVLARFNATLASAQAELKGLPSPLGPREVAELCGEWYRQQAARDPEAGATASAWGDYLDHYAGMFPRDPAVPEDDSAFAPDPDLLQEAAALLRTNGIPATREAVLRMAEGLADTHIRFAQRQIRLAQRDWSPDPALDRFPEPKARPAAPAPAAPAQSSPAVPIADLVAAWARETGTTGKPLYERQRHATALATFLGHDDAAKVTPEDAVRWKEARLALGRSVKTVGWELGSMRPIWAWAKANRKLAFTDNPFAGIAPRERKTATKARVAHTEEDARRVLESARTAKGFLRWLPWVICFTGARLGEVCQSDRDDIQQHGAGGVWFIRVHEDGAGRSLKTPQSARMVPLHPALIAEGFLDYVNTRPAGSTLWPDLVPDIFGHKRGTATKRFGRWVRKTVGITDERKDPAHAFRHRFEEQAQRAGLPQNITDALMGHLATGNESATYGKGLGNMPDVTAPWIAKMASPMAPASP